MDEGEGQRRRGEEEEEGCGTESVAKKKRQ